MEDQSTNPFDPSNDFFSALTDYKPEEVKDEGDFKPLKGSYIVRVAKLTHNIGVSTKDGNPYDFYALNMQITQTVDGDKGENRYLNKRYQNTPEKIKALMNDLYTAGIDFEKTSREAFDLSLSGAIDKQMRVRTWVWTPDKKVDGTPIAEDDRVAIQQMKIVSDFQKKGKSASSDNVPF